MKPKTIMKIISPQLGISPKATTGGEAYGREVLKQFVKLGQDVCILLPKGKLAPREIPEEMIDRTPIGHFVPPYTYNFFALPWLIKRLKEEGKRKKVVVRIHSPEFLFPTAYLVRKLFPKVLMVAHYHLDQTSLLWTKMNRKLLNMMDGVVVDSQYLKGPLVNRVGVNEKIVHVVHCGVDIEGIHPRSQKSKVKSQKFRTLLYLGRFVERKRPDFAIEVFAKLHRKHPNTKLIMIGNGPMQRQLQKQVTSYKLQGAVEFMGPLFGKEKLKKYHEADLFIFPSEKEGFVLVVLEAMAAGLPMLVPDALGFPEAVVDGENGLLAEVGKIDDWVRKAERILYSPDLGNKMGRKSRELAIGKFSWEECAKKNLEVYENI